MLTFEKTFYPDVLSCVLWADEPLRRVCFHIGHKVLQDVLHGGNPGHDEANVRLCEAERPRIEAACRRAFANRPSGHIALQPTDFDQ